MVRRAQLDDGSLRRCFRDALERPVLEAGGDIPPVAVRDRFAAAGEGRLEEPAGECYRLRAVQVHRYEPAGGPAVDDADVLAVVEVARGVLEADAEVLPVRDPWALLAGWYRDRRPTALYVAGRGLRATHAMRSAEFSATMDIEPPLWASGVGLGRAGYSPFSFACYPFTAVSSCWRLSSKLAAVFFCRRAVSSSGSPSASNRCSPSHTGVSANSATPAIIPRSSHVPARASPCSMIHRITSSASSCTSAIQFAAAAASLKCGSLGSSTCRRRLACRRSSSSPISAKRRSSSVPLNKLGSGGGACSFGETSLSSTSSVRALSGIQ